MVKEEDFLFNVPVGMKFWVLGEHNPLIISFFILVVSSRNWRLPWMIKGSDWESGTARSF